MPNLETRSGRGGRNGGEQLEAQRKGARTGGGEAGNWKKVSPPIQGWEDLTWAALRRTTCKRDRHGNEVETDENKQTKKSQKLRGRGKVK